MRAFVTGAAGFIGSTLCAKLLSDGHEVVGIDSLSPYYDVQAKLANLAGIISKPNFRFEHIDLKERSVADLLSPETVVFHHAAQPGVRASWESFESYSADNIVATRNLLDSTVKQPVEKFIYASSSSIYGDSAVYPTSEAQVPQPQSPYGVTKLAAEHLVNVYSRNHGLSVVSLRYFTVYGPRQRPDMAIQRLVRAALTHAAFPLFGDGEQRRDFTFVDDVVQANLQAATVCAPPHAVYNVAGGSDCSMNELISLVESIVKSKIEVTRLSSQAGDVQRTGGDVSRIMTDLEWKPAVSLAEGVEEQVQWARSLNR